jgi:hypothetical protein
VKFKASLDKKSGKSNYMNTENLQIKYPVGFENAVEMTRNEIISELEVTRIDEKHLAR